MDPGISDSNMDDTDYQEEKTKEKTESGFIRRLSRRFSKRGKKREVEHKFEEITKPAGYEHEDLHMIMKRLKRELDTLKKMHRDWEQPAKRPKLDPDFKELTAHVYDYANMIANRVGIPTVQKNVTERLQGEISELKEENRNLRERSKNDRRIQDRDNEILRLKREIKTLQSEITSKRASESDHVDGESESRRHSRGRPTRREENGTPDTSKYVIFELQETIEKDKSKIQEYESEIQNLRDQLENSKDDNKVLSKRSGSAVTEVESLRQKVEELSGNQSEYDETIASLHQEIENKKEVIRQLSHGGSKPDSGHSQETSDEESLKRKCREQAATIKKNMETIEKLREHVHAERKAKEDALTRLGNAASKNMRNANPGITDLSDPDRPTKLAEKFSELYDNEWTNAMENLEEMKKPEKDSVEILLKLVTKVYDMCKAASTVQMSYIPIYLSIPLLDELDVASLQFKQSEEIPTDVLKSIKEFRKNNVDQAFPHIKKVIKNRILEKKMLDNACLQACDEYVDSAIRQCWSMVVQDPPVHMVSNYGQGSKFDHNVMRSYTQSGEFVDYVVWPVLFLHEDGPLLSKGVVQGCKKKSEESFV